MGRPNRKSRRSRGKKIRRYKPRTAKHLLPLAMQAKIDSANERETTKHLRVLQEVIAFSKLNDEHPLRKTLNNPTSLARFQLHHLADDLIVLKGVEGLKGLVKRIVTDSEAYEDYRFELRIAANIARSRTSRVLRLAGNRAGPDVEFQSVDGKECGLACYRARGEAVRVEDVDDRCFEVMTAFALAFARYDILSDAGLEVIFPSFPPRAEEWTEAENLIVRLWSTADPPEIDGARGVRVRRCVKISSLAHFGIPRRARVRFMFPLSDRERSRSIRHIEEKLLMENKWGSVYSGCPLFVFEASPWDSTPSIEELAVLLNQQRTAFVGLLASEITYPVSEGIAYSMEDLKAHAPSLLLSFETFGQNMKVWAGDAPVIGRTPKHSCTFWDVNEKDGVFEVTRSMPLNLEREWRKLEQYIVKESTGVSQEVVQALGESAAQMQVRAQEGAFEW